MTLTYYMLTARRSGIHHVWTRSTYPFLTYSAFTADTLQHVLTLTFDFDLKHFRVSAITWRTLCQIWAEPNNPRLSYSDLKAENFCIVRHLGFHRKWIFTIYGLRDP